MKLVALIIAASALAFPGMASARSKSHHGHSHGGHSHSGHRHYSGHHHSGGHHHHGSRYYGSGYYGSRYIYPSYGLGLGYAGYGYGGYGYSGYGYPYYNSYPSVSFVYSSSSPRYYSSSSYRAVADSLEVDVQRELKRRGYYRGPIDGDIGPGSRSAIRGYQADRGLAVTGRIDASLLRSLGI